MVIFVSLSVWQCVLIHVVSSVVTFVSSVCGECVSKYVAAFCVEVCGRVCVNGLCQCLWEVFVLTFMLRSVLTFVARLA